jgi:uncharacterized protein YjiS (DUF1127 family)
LELQDMSKTLPGSVPLGAYRFDRHTSGPLQIAALAARLTALIGLWSARSRQRRDLGELALFNAHLLKDIGLTPDQAAREEAKWFWQGEPKS